MQTMRVGVQKVVDEVEQLDAQENLDPNNKSYLTRMKVITVIEVMCVLAVCFLGEEEIQCVDGRDG